MLHHHHDLEETTIFPRFCKEVGDPNLMKGPLAEHREFDEGLERYAAYLKEVKEGREELDGEKLRAIVDEVIPVVHRHLVHEIDELLSLGKYDHVDWEALFEELVQAAANTDMKHSWYRVSLSACSHMEWTVTKRKKAANRCPKRRICSRWCCICTIKRMKGERSRASRRCHGSCYLAYGGSFAGRGRTGGVSRDATGPRCRKSFPLPMRDEQASNDAIAGQSQAQEESVDGSLSADRASNEEPSWNALRAPYLELKTVGHGLPNSGSEAVQMHDGENDTKLRMAALALGQRTEAEF
jgi:hypothetical protein